MTFGTILDTSMDPMEETRFKKKHSVLINQLARKTHFDVQEVETLLVIYYKLQKDGPEKQMGVNKSQFRDFLHKCLNMTDDYLMDKIFLAVDKGPVQYLSMETWITTLSLFLRGTLEEHIIFCFSVYDMMGEGILGRETMFNLLRTSIIGQTEEDSEEAAKDLIEVITKKMDLDRDGKISFNDYRQTVLANPMLLEAFGYCLPSRGDINAFQTTFTNHVGKM
ncbi:unnamed protein product [Brassicogethes aeneus]|uniref:EF-hand domain-containing protein n=1 Tax=Brassicogethes aeneus TaxID=1431903 RepID=A0A9P0BAE4_BRAAE|nr:unnamed protein product [Brassicogethes aeneus]